MTVGFLALAVTALLQPDPALDSLADATTRLSARYADRRVAMADGYRRVGTDFPGMGEHWIQVGTLVAGRIDAARPTILAYATIDGRSTLIGVGFVLTTQGDTAEPDAPGWPEEWHEHSGLLAQESGIGAGHAHGGAHAPLTPTATRVWVLHIWTELENPEGRYRSDNWALPFARVGLVAPPGVDADAGRAFSLPVGGKRFLAAALADAGLLTDANIHRVSPVLDAAEAESRRIAQRATARGAANADDLLALRVAWRRMVEELRVEAGAGVESLLAPPHASKFGERIQPLPRPMSDRFELPVDVTPADFDELGHVNNVVYLRWVQDIATAHWRAAATAEQLASTAWVALRHEIDYKHPALPGDAILASTWVGAAEAVRFERFVEILRASDRRVLAQSRTLWVPISRSTGRITRVGADVRRVFSRG